MYPALPPPRLQVLIATHRAPGIERVAAMALPELEGVQYIVSWQDCDGIPEPEYFSRRRDISVRRFYHPGVSANRNNLLELATAPFVLIADDDLVYTPDSLLGALAIMENNPDTDYFSFRYSGADNKPYPEAETSLATLPKGFYQTAFEVGLNRSRLGRELRFNEYFGPGAPFFTAAEDEIFLYTARRNGLVCRYFPFTVCSAYRPNHRLAHHCARRLLPVARSSNSLEQPPHMAPADRTQRLALMAPPPGDALPHMAADAPGRHARTACRLYITPLFHSEKWSTNSPL